MGLSSLPTAGDAFFPFSLLAYALLPLARLLNAARWAAGGGEQDESSLSEDEYNRPAVVLAAGVRVKSLELLRDEGECCVCLRGFGESSEEEEEEEVSEVVTCGHFFHRDCLERWLSHLHSTCPLCRASLLA
ncbi:RING-H2 finger protein ATL51-like [Canna indica]|uniref:RING-H2 finger protein ATL51-like n=1 Tax=Canna indica TaxID=4628 RepID=A0AAQ3KBA1_9LILI|nr:RING-H2 finger protein ATL51-like [Canna indica]